jgi:hypothetical protein
MKKLTGADYFKVVRAQENRCEKLTRMRMPKLGKRVPECMEKVGEAMLIMDAAASCFWGCRGGDHNIEYLLGRASSSSRAATVAVFRLL